MVELRINRVRINHSRSVFLTFDMFLMFATTNASFFHFIQCSVFITESIFMIACQDELQNYELHTSLTCVNAVQEVCLNEKV